MSSCNFIDELSWRGLIADSTDITELRNHIQSGQFGDVPTIELSRELLQGPGLNAVDLVAATGLAYSKREAREHLRNGAVQINDTKPDIDTTITARDLFHNSMVLVRRGKRQWHVARFI
jgi:tyrosyl-tRNA synthetase